MSTLDSLHRFRSRADEAALRALWQKRKYVPMRRRLASLARSWVETKERTAESVLAQTAGLNVAPRFQEFVERWVEGDDDELYEARGQKLRARGDYPGLSEAAQRPERPAWAEGLEASASAIAAEYDAAASGGGHEPFFGGDYGERYDGVPIASGGRLAPEAAARFPETVAALIGSSKKEMDS